MKRYLLFLLFRGRLSVSVVIETSAAMLAPKRQVAGGNSIPATMPVATEKQPTNY